MTRSIDHRFDEIATLAHQLQHQIGELEIRTFVVTTDVVDFASLAVFERAKNRYTMIVDM